MSDHILSFDSFGLGPALNRAIAAMKFVEPWPIQVQTIPAMLAGKDVLGLAETGTGKTAAFALPILHSLMTTRGRGVRALVVAPTRELAMQIETELRALARFTGVKSMTIYGGVSTRKQIDGLKRRPDIVVGCPGRLLDLLGQGQLRLGGVETLVLDEADHLFDMGFLPDIRKILKALPPKRQNLLFSATMPDAVRHLADDVLSDPHRVELSRTAPAGTIDHYLYPVALKGKFDLLKSLIVDEHVTSAIVFTRTKHRARKLAVQLDKAGWAAVALQGNMSQGQRDRAMAGFRKGEFDILVATDIAARGLDVAQVSHVINFDIPGTPEAYTHRIGRTGRAERSGEAFTFVTSEDESLLREIERTIGAAIPRRVIERYGDRHAAPKARPSDRKAEPRDRSQERRHKKNVYRPEENYGRRRRGGHARKRRTQGRRVSS